MRYVFLCSHLCKFNFRLALRGGRGERLALTQQSTFKWPFLFHMWCGSGWYVSRSVGTWIQRRVLSVLLHGMHPTSFRQGLWLTLELGCQPASPAILPSLALPAPASEVHEGLLMSFCMDAGDSESGPHDCTTSTLTPWAIPRPLYSVISAVVC